jgi:hypothetical protein
VLCGRRGLGLQRLNQTIDRYALQVADGGGGSIKRWYRQSIHDAGAAGVRLFSIPDKDSRFDRAATHLSDCPCARELGLSSANMTVYRQRTTTCRFEGGPVFVPHTRKSPEGRFSLACQGGGAGSPRLIIVNTTLRITLASAIAINRLPTQARHNARICIGVLMPRNEANPIPKQMPGPIRAVDRRLFCFQTDVLPTDIKGIATKRP